VLLKVDGTTILTDPVFSDRVGLSLGPVTLGLKRLVAPAATLSLVPKVDLVLLSHAHMDHFDIPTLRSLESRNTSVVTAAKTSDLLRTRWYREVRELKWGERARVGAANVRAIEVNHWGARMRTDTYRGYNGYLIEVGRYRILFGGDTAVTPAFRAVRSSKPVDLAIMPIGAYNPPSFRSVHTSPADAMRAFFDLNARWMVPMHYGTFRLSHEPMDEPLQLLEKEAKAAGIEDRVFVLEEGVTKFF
jgi:L-ascorbate metabolism protein UlaG (beta-lactamase superfamily)